MMPNRSVRLVALALWIALCVGGGALIGVTTEGDGSTWYASINEPSWTSIFTPCIRQLSLNRSSAAL